MLQPARVSSIVESRGRIPHHALEGSRGWRDRRQFSVGVGSLFSAVDIVAVIFTVARFLFSAAPPELERISIPTLVLICLVLLALAPLLVFAVGKLVTRAFEPRYAFICAIGLLPLIAIAIRDAARQSALWMAAAVLILGSCAALVRYHAIRGMSSNGDPLTVADARVFSANPCPAATSFLSHGVACPAISAQALHISDGP